MVAIWLILSPFIFSYPAEATWLWIITFSAAALILICSLTAFLKSYGALHFVNMLLGILLVVYVFAVADSHPSPPYQNLVVVGLLLLMLGILPNESRLPPPEWRKFYLEGKLH